jgi:hypothetical protein
MVLRWIGKQCAGSVVAAASYAAWRGAHVDVRTLHRESSKNMHTQYAASSM